MEMALEVAMKCGLDTHDVWTAWGLADLRLGHYAAAREKFRRSLTRSEAVTLQGASRDPHLVTRIVMALEDAVCPLVEDMRFMHESLRALVAGVKSDGDPLVSFGVRSAPATPSAPSTPQRARVVEQLVVVTAVTRGRVSESSNMDSERFREAEYYLTTYGTAEMLVVFHMKHGALLKACQAVISQNLATPIFVDKIFLPCVNSKRLDVLEEIMLGMDKSLDKWRPYLMDVCQRARSSQAFNLLYSLEMYMKNHYRAGLTRCRMASLRGMTMGDRLEHLQASKNLFQEAAGAGSREAEVCLETVQHQVEAIKLFDFEARLLQADESPSSKEHGREAMQQTPAERAQPCGPPDHCYRAAELRVRAHCRGCPGARDPHVQCL